MKGPLVMALAVGAIGSALVAAPKQPGKTASRPAKQVARTTRPAAQTGKKPAVAPAVKPKPLSGNVNKGLAWLAKRQLKNGGWGQGEEAEAMGHDQDQLRDKANVADTCMAALALIRSGSTPHSGPYQENVRRART